MSECAGKVSKTFHLEPINTERS